MVFGESCQGCCSERRCTILCCLGRSRILFWPQNQPARGVEVPCRGDLHPQVPPDPLPWSSLLGSLAQLCAGSDLCQRPPSKWGETSRFWHTVPWGRTNSLIPPTSISSPTKPPSLSPSIHLIPPVPVMKTAPCCLLYREGGFVYRAAAVMDSKIHPNSPGTQRGGRRWVRLTASQNTPTRG